MKQIIIKCLKKLINFLKKKDNSKLEVKNYEDKYNIFLEELKKDYVLVKKDYTKWFSIQELNNYWAKPDTSELDKVIDESYPLENLSVPKHKRVQGEKLEKRSNNETEEELKERLKSEALKCYPNCVNGEDKPKCYSCNEREEHFRKLDQMQQASKNSNKNK